LNCSTAFSSTAKGYSRKLSSRHWPNHLANYLNSVDLEQPGAVALNSRLAVEKTAAAKRIPAFDFTKGALVLFMVLYHWLNYFVGLQGEYYNYLHFLTPSFIFITGFLISHVHFGKYGTGSARLSARLLIRGLKILALFVSMNLLIAIFLRNSSVRQAFFSGSLSADLYRIFVSGDVLIDGIGKAASFTILVPIGYLLISSAGLSLLCRFSRYTFHFACALLLLFVIFRQARGVQDLNPGLLMIGLLGVVLGYATSAQVATLVSHRLALCGAYCLYLAAVTIWGVPLPLMIAGVILTTTLIYIVGDKKGQMGLLRGHIVLLGKYSLFGYLSQILILQVLRYFFRVTELGTGTLLLSLLLGFALTMGSVEILDYMRPRVSGVDRLYKAVFA
jgi:peptidoglycan/LPS O-acetylase OafA/YrhL